MLSNIQSFKASFSCLTEIVVSKLAGFCKLKCRGGAMLFPGIAEPKSFGNSLDREIQNRGYIFYNLFSTSSFKNVDVFDNAMRNFRA